ncbi:hypothetical protein HBP99_13820 [Listeria booriae]|uniref:FtsK/SpoIIIE domain-containing protein n=1 Tax=Listeria booriae TaxID=1552123 RepID=UPI001624688E|nr:FtsK/SpoIIIE domain-containing protein [Listeria booriae]MBC2369720.1 hypothetical protein [Listeria booriae]
MHRVNNGVAKGGDFFSVAVLKKYDLFIDRMQAISGGESIPMFEFFRYKGVRILSTMKNAVLIYLSTVFVLSYFLAFYFRWQALLDLEMKQRILKASVSSFLWSIPIFIVLFFLSYFYLKQLLAYQRLARMIWNSRFYLIDNVETPSLFNGKKRTVKRKITYFTRMYFHKRGRNIRIMIHLDGSGFHDKYKELGSKFEDMFSGDLITKTVQRSFIVYDMIAEFNRDRLSIKDITVDGYTIPLMKDVEWNVAKVPHGLVIGGTGGGKTYFLFTLIIALLKINANLFIFDIKRSALSALANVLPNVKIKPTGMMRTMREFYEAMLKRYDYMKSLPEYIAGKDFSYYQLQANVLIIDEFVALISALPKEEQAKFYNYLRQIILMGREAGYFVILTTQRPDASFMPGDIRDQLSLRVALGSLTAEGYRMAFGAVDKTFINHKEEHGRGYIYIDGVTPNVRGFYSPLVPEGYNFIEAIKEVAGGAHVVQAQDAPSGNGSDEAEPDGEASPRQRIKEIVMEEEA